MEHQTTDTESARIRYMADKLDCFIEEDFQLLAMATENTVEAWRKRGHGPAYIRLGNRYLYPRKSVAEFMESIVRVRGTEASVKGML